MAWKKDCLLWKLIEKNARCQAPYEKTLIFLEKVLKAKSSQRMFDQD